MYFNVLIVLIKALFMLQKIIFQTNQINTYPQIFLNIFGTIAILKNHYNFFIFWKNKINNSFFFIFSNLNFFFFKKYYFFSFNIFFKKKKIINNYFSQKTFLYQNSFYKKYNTNEIIPLSSIYKKFNNFIFFKINFNFFFLILENWIILFFFLILEKI